MKEVTKENFEQFVDKYVSNRKFVGLKMPKNEKEFKLFTKLIYGIELNVECLAYPTGSFKNHEYNCKYQITGLTHSEYSKNEIMKLWDKKFGQYDGLKVLLNTCFGELICGGVATYHYGQTKCDKKTWNRIKNWSTDNGLKVLKSQIQQTNSIVDIFGFNPFN